MDGLERLDDDGRMLDVLEVSEGLEWNHDA